MLLAIFLLTSFDPVAAQDSSPYQEVGSNVSFASVLALNFSDANEIAPYGEENATLQYGRLWLPESEFDIAQANAPLIVFIHGGCWSNAYDISHTFAFSTALAQAGYAVWSLEYRRSGDEGGGWPGTLDDIVAGIAFVNSLSDYPVDTQQMVIVGHSAGGHLALLAGRQFLQAKAVIGLAAITNIASYSQGFNSCQSATADFMGAKFPDSPDIYRQANPVDNLRHPNTILLQGSSDTIVPVSQAQLAAATTHLVEGAGHFDWVHPGTKAFQQLLITLAEILAQ